ncbi:MAG: YbaB/EbfC family nucleoid-associated protein [Lachnospiraceae bacterium]|nr:YbaB/EbfC family nucleoid-associated protein [Lachnospiraceae bacterium]
MAKHGGYMGGMPGNMNNLMKQAQRMQQQMQQKQEELENKDYTASSGGGAVKVTVNGKYEVKEILIDREVVDPEDVEMLQDLITAAMNEVLKQIGTEAQESMSKFTGGMGLF